MNLFDKKLREAGAYPLKAEDINTLQVNMTYKCNLSCSHCHVEASPARTEQMSLETVDTIIELLRAHDQIKLIDITGGSPEYNPSYRRLIEGASDAGKGVIVRTNLAVIIDEGLTDFPAFWARMKVKIVASMPCYSAEGVDAQRGKGTYDKAVSVLKDLNELGYGQEGSGLELDLMFNPAAQGMAPDQFMLEKAYRDKLSGMHGIVFNKLIALGNMPIGRLGRKMTAGEKGKYIKDLETGFNPATVKNVMCRHIISVSPDGTLYDCDFWQMLKLPVKNRRANDVSSFDYSELAGRDILTATLCFMCTAGSGASCSGALV